jgi:signal transduction histidine kinase
LLAATVRGVTAQMDEVRLPLHILLDARFGELNENQEELLVAARAAADGIDGAVRRLAVVADADRDALMVRTEPVAINDVVRAVLPMVRATADRRNVRVDVALEPALPRVWANRAALAETIALMAGLAAERLGEGDAMSIGTTAEESQCVLQISPAEASLLDEPLVIGAMRVLHAQNATAGVAHGAVEIVLPRTLASPSS